ncbi:hypothetical protein IMZ31_19430 (plasmid) [Pontibacillus sp. ALD_SL1]|uniref:hypothetical protein n=1 Tax=Pontibacillus sp. ALD_SL1 TaxID=2777185 RepID=UPI001A972BFB|nr:hypothetical protein [Pontibacillus sp. ALD_SL1]QST02723.1 hypothetical protein IMZ31_19430 [Pontibacillus sp. ALD_SL1]
MKTTRHRAILQAAGYHKRGEEYVKSIPCFTCRGKGNVSGFLAEGSYPHVNTWYDVGRCPDCKGTGTFKDVTTVSLEKAFTHHPKIDESLFQPCAWCSGSGTERAHISDTGYDCPDCEGTGMAGGRHAEALFDQQIDNMYRKYARSS